jgi:hypothetical protein
MRVELIRGHETEIEKQKNRKREAERKLQNREFACKRLGIENERKET